jgi:membrane fusion protein (multidrug efflux system)
MVKWVLIMCAVVALAWFGWRYWRSLEFHASTDDAYVNADKVEIAAQVQGPVLQLYVAENQAVKAGDALFDIDPQSYRLALDKAEAQLRIASQSMSQESAAVTAAEAQLAQRRAELANAEDNLRRSQRLVSRGFLSEQGGESARTQMATARAAVRAAEANLEQAKSALGSAGSDNAAVQAARAALDQARLDLMHTHVTAPADGAVTNMSLRPGNIVQPGVPLFVIISNRGYWIDANFKETELERIKPGERVTIEVDMYPDHAFHGVVESVSGGSGTVFSLLPPQNATGNWVKVTQRVPVRVRVLDPDPRHPLRIGTTATVRVDVAP